MLRYGVIICAYNEATYIDQVIRNVLALSPAELVLIDDGSNDHTAALAQQAGAHVLRNRKNLGKGSSLRRGIKYLLERNVEAVIVLDGDGQHDPVEIPRFLDAYERTRIPVLIGNRMSDVAGMPTLRAWTNRFMAFILHGLVKVYIPDPPCGFRFYRSDVLPYILSDEPRFAFEFDVLIRAAKRRIRMDSVRISTRYAPDQKSHVKPIRDGWLLARVIRKQFFTSP